MFLVARVRLQRLKIHALFIEPTFAKADALSTLSSFHFWNKVRH
jgi:hypothetical protein